MTYKEAKEILKTAKNKNIGKPLGEGYYLMMDKQFLVVKKGLLEALRINSKNEFTLGLIKPTRSVLNIVNQFLPYKLKIKSGLVYIGNMEYWKGMRLDSNGEVMIDQAWDEDSEYTMTCFRCETRYSNTHCSNCVSDYIEELETDAETIEPEGDPDDYDDDYNQPIDDWS
jgi:hypothetical protein